MVKKGYLQAAQRTEDAYLSPYTSAMLKSFLSSFSTA